MPLNIGISLRISSQTLYGGGVYGKGTFVMNDGIVSNNTDYTGKDTVQGCDVTVYDLDDIQQINGYIKTSILDYDWWKV